MKMVVDIGKYSEIPTKDIDGFNERLLRMFPNLKTNCCGLGYEGGFLDRLTEGTYLAHVLEHVILDMQNTLGCDVAYGKTRAIDYHSSVYYLVYEFTNEACGVECSKVAVYILNSFLNGYDVDITETMEYLRKITVDGELGPSTSAIVNEAKGRGLPVERFGYDSLARIGYGKYSRVIQSTLTDSTSCISADTASNKQLTKLILSDNQIPVPYGKVVYSELSAIMAAKDIGTPVVIKPYDGNQGKGVHLNLTNESDIKDAFKDASSFSSAVIVEQYVTGLDYRLLVVGNKVRAATKRLSAAVIGDGVHNIKGLIDIINLDKNRGVAHEKPLTKIRLDSVALNVLKKKGIGIDYIPQKGEVVVLRENSNISTGGTAVDCTDIMHPENAEIAVRAAAAIGLDIAGIDIVSEDISKPIKEFGGAIVEVNAAPGLRMHLYPSEGRQRNVAKDIVDMLFPNDFEFPLVSVTGTNGKTTTTRLIAHTLSLAGKTVGMTTTNGIFIDGKCVSKGDNTGPISAKMVLSNKLVDAAVLETARGGIIRGGLGFDLADVGVITNVTGDHLGLDGINDLIDLAFVKSLVVEAIKEDGYAVLNAEDSMTDYILQRVKAKVILFSKDKNRINLGQNYIYVFASDGIIYIQNGNKLISVINVNDIPITHNGLVECNIENSLASVAALYALKIPVETIALGLKSFSNNPGRFNIIDMNGYRVMVDYMHNKAGFEAVLKSSKGFKFNRLVGVIGIPGDRQDEVMKEIGGLCANSFDRLYIKEDKDLRGRKQGEVAEILHSAITSSGFSSSNVTIIGDELTAIKSAITDARTDDLIIVSYEKLDPVMDFLNNGLQ